MNDTYSLCILKPDCIQRGLSNEIYDVIKKQELSAILTFRKKLDIDEIIGIYGKYSHFDFYEDLIKYMAEGDSEAAIIVGRNAVEKLNKLVGYRDPLLAEKGSLRQLYGLNILKNSIHSSNMEDVDDEIKVLYGESVLKILKTSSLDILKTLSNKKYNE